MTSLFFIGFFQHGAGSILRYTSCASPHLHLVQKHSLRSDEKLDTVIADETSKLLFVDKV